MFTAKDCTRKQHN